MQQYLTLEEAAKMLQLSADELREMARKKTIRAFQDRGSWRFRLQDMQEEARKRGINSDPEVQLGEGQKNVEDDEVPLGREKRSQGPRSSRTKSPPPGPKPGSDSDVRLVLDEDVQLSIDLDSDRKKVDLAGPKSSRGNATKNPKRQSRLDSTDSGVRLVGGPNDPSDSDVKVVPSGKDSGVERKQSNDPSDSDIRLNDLPSSDKKKGREANVITEEIDLDAEEARLAEKAKKKGKDGGKKQPTMMKGNSPLPTQSPFEISEPDFDLDRPSSGRVPKPKKKKSEVDSSSDFELVPFDASKSPDVPLLDDDNVDLGGHVAGGRGGNSGINLDDPADGGISLESGGSDEMEFELTLDDDPPSKSSKKIAKPKVKAADDSSSEFELSLDDSSAEESAVQDVNSSSEFELSVDDSDDAGSSEFELSLDASDESSALVSPDENSDSEFELTLDDDGGLAADDEDGKDIFEDTSFDVPALDDDSGSQAVAIDDADTDLEGSDFEISLDEDSSTDDNAGSAIALDEDEEADEGAATVARAKKPAPKKGKKGAALVPNESQVDLDIEDSAPVAKKGKKVATDEEVDSEDDLERPAAAAPVASDWGAFPAVLLFPTFVVLFVVGLMGFELVRGMWGYHRPSPVGRPIIDSIARQIDDTLPK